MFSKCFWLSIVIFSTISIAALQASQDAATSELWYPFLKDGKWGFIDEKGTWKISPTFDGIYDVFTGNIIRVWVKGKWGYIDRNGSWITKPQFEEPLSDFSEAGYQVVLHDKKQGIIARDGHIVVPAKYNEIILSKDRAWVRLGNALGVIGFDGKWIHKPNIPWAVSNSLPNSVNSDGVAWFQQGQDVEGEWGLIAEDGKILFIPQFDAHYVGRHEEDAWDRPEGTDFQAGSAWVKKGDEFWLIAKDGKILERKPFTTVSAWSEGVCHFSDKKGTGLISAEGKTIFYGEGVAIRDLHDGLAVFSQSVQNGSNTFLTTFGVLSPNGQVLVPAGTYTSIEDFQEGFAAAIRQTPPRENSQNDRSHDSHAGFLGKDGREAIPFTYYNVQSFSDGLAPVLKFFDGNGNLDPNHAYWGYVDQKGVEQIPREFAVVTPFYRDRAWVCKSSDGMGGSGPKIPVYALIDQTGKVLTDFRFVPPDMEKQYMYPPDKLLSESRWRGSLAVLIGRNTNVGGLGLATSDGKILVEPQFHDLGPMSDGMIRALTWNATDFLSHTGYLSEQGDMVIPAIYTQGNDFENGSAWVTKVTDNHKGHVENQGWLLIDHQGKVLTDNVFLDPGFIVNANGHGSNAPSFIGDLACVAAAKGYQPYGENRLMHLDWGYVDHAGARCAWHAAEAK